MYLDQHCERTRKVLNLEDGYPDIHRFLDKHYEEIRHEVDKCSVLTSGDWYPAEKRPDPCSHKKFLHHREGIEIAVSHFTGIYDETLVRKVCELHIKDDYEGIIPVKSDFSDPVFINKYHR